MSRVSPWLQVLPAAALGLALFGCEEEKQPAAPAATTNPTPTVSAAPTTSSAPTPKATGPKPSHACPEGSKGEGTFKAPCVPENEDANLMEVKWTGKITDKGPSFRVVSKSDLEIMYGLIYVYFYDKAGKQLELPKKDSDGKANLFKKCSGNIFAGPMKPGEKAVLWFSCVRKDDVPEGTEAIEGEMVMVGFTGEGTRRADTYWRNDALGPDERPKGGAKKK